MGQITNPIVKGITVNPVDRQSGPGAGGGALGNNVILLGATAGANEAINNAIIIGNGTGGGGLVDVANLSGSTIVGVGSATAITAGDGSGRPLTLFGSNDLVGYTGVVGSTVIVGSKILDGVDPAGPPAGITSCVFVGNNIFPASINHFSAHQNSVCIGDSINSFGTVAGTNSALTNAVMIGCQIMTLGSNSSYSNCVFVGGGISSSSFGVSGAENLITAIGANITLSGVGSSNTLIGSQIQFSGASTGGESNNTIIGNAVVYTGNANTVLGSSAVVPGIAANASVGNVIIGAKAGSDLPATTNNLLAIGASLALSGVPSYLLYGSFASGNLILGNSVTAVNRDFGGVPGTNMLKLLNGTKATGANVVGGGYFYVTGGFLHWVDPNGTDSQLSETVAGQLASSALTAFTNNAGASAGTLGNAPVAGNPTKWIPINDAGTIRNIPAW
jgi:hypothetical protein